MKVFNLTAFVVTAVIVAGSAVAPAQASIFGDIVSFPGKVVGKVTGASAAGAAAAAGKTMREQEARRKAAEADKSQWGWLKDKDYVACLKTMSNTQCNLKFYGVSQIRR